MYYIFGHYTSIIFLIFLQEFLNDLDRFINRIYNDFVYKNVIKKQKRNSFFI